MHKLSRTPDVRQYELPSWLWLWVVPSFLVLQLIIRGISPEFAKAYLGGEHGIVENLTVLSLIPAILFALYLVLNFKHLPSFALALWYGLLGLACIYFAGEEASWGQHWLGWDTPDSIMALNDQGETNLHNMSSWFDQKPRLVVELAAIIGGVIVPILYRWKGVSFAKGSWQSLFWPTWVCVPVSLIVGLVKIPDRLFGAQNIPYPFNLRVSETQELYIAIAFSIYLASVAIRVSRAKKETGQ